MRAFLLALLLAPPALAQDFPPPAPGGEIPRCAPRSQIVYRLANQFEEYARRQAAEQDGAAIWEWFDNEESGTMTLVRTTPDMKACIVATGLSSSASMPVNPDDPA